MEPANIDLIAWIGGKKVTPIKFFRDKAQTEPFSLASYTVELVVEGGLVLKVGAGLVVTGNEIIITLTAAHTTAAARLSRAHYYVRLVPPDGEPEFPIHGTITFEEP